MSVSDFLRLPPVIAGTALLAQRVLTRSAKPRTATTVLGTAVAATGGMITVAGRRTFLDAETTLDPSHPDEVSRLVTSGIFARTRNPMYLGLAMVLLGHALHRRDVWALLPIGAFVGAIDRTQVPREEAALRQAFGSDYDDYTSRVRRWV